MIYGKLKAALVAEPGGAHTVLAVHSHVICSEEGTFLEKQASIELDGLSYRDTNCQFILQLTAPYHHKADLQLVTSCGYTFSLTRRATYGVYRTQDEHRFVCLWGMRAVTAEARDPVYISLSVSPAWSFRVSSQYNGA